MPRDSVLVARDGSGHYTTITEAVKAATGRSRCVIHVKEGEYAEYLEILTDFITLRGDGKGKTIITGNRSWVGGFKTYDSATVAVTGKRFIAQGITFRNTAGADHLQAVALMSESDQSVFYECSFEGYQDTLYVKANHQFYRDCDVYGTVDFICGDAAAILQNCNIFVRRPLNNTNTITAQKRASKKEKTGIVIHNSRVTAASDLQSVLGSTNTYLGRPWEKYSRTVFMKTYLDNLIDPRGWDMWEGREFATTLFYGEFQNIGPGASTSNRVTWPGFKILSASEASNFTVGKFIAGNTWIPPSIPFTNGL